MDIDGLGESWVAIFLDRGLIKDPADIYFLTKEQLIALDRMGEKSAEKLIKNIDASKKASLGRLLFALGIRHVGGEIAQVLANHFHTLDAMLEASAEEIQAVERIGPKDRRERARLLPRTTEARDHREAAHGRRQLRRSERQRRGRAARRA